VLRRLGRPLLRGAPFRERTALLQEAPVCGDLFHLPQNKAIDRRLLTGAALFGIGWGLAGFCPGPALAGLLAGNAETWVVVPAMLAGAWLQRRTNPAGQHRH